MMRPVYLTLIGDSIAVAANDDLNLGGMVGRIADWALTQPGLKVRFIGKENVTNHGAGSADAQGCEGTGGYEFADFVASLANRVDHNKLPTGVPMFGPAATSIYQPIDFVIDCGGANELNNIGQPTATTHARHRAWLTALRSSLDARGLTACKIVVQGGYLDINAPYHTQVVDANATVQTAVYDAIDALNPGRPLIRLPNWGTRVGDWAGTGVGFNYYDDIHPNGAGYNAIANGASGMIAQLGPYILAAANDGAAMGTLSTYAKNKLLDHKHNLAAYTPAATHYLHLYADAACTVPLTSGTASGYVAKSQTNNTTTWANLASRIKATAIAWTFASPTGTWPAVLGWKLTDSATEGAGNVLASDSHTAVPVSVATGPISYAAGAITITAATHVSVGGWTDAAAAELMNLMFGATANSPRATVYGSYWAGDPAGAGTIAGGSVAITQASTWGAASGGLAVTTADITLTQQATGTYWAEHSAAAGGGTLLYVAPRPASVGAGGTIQAGQLQAAIG